MEGWAVPAFLKKKREKMSSSLERLENSGPKLITTSDTFNILYSRKTRSLPWILCEHYSKTPTPTGGAVSSG